MKRLTDAAGFRYAYDPATQSFLHATSLIFATREGRIVRYIGGIEFLPVQLKMALFDADERYNRPLPTAFKLRAMQALDDGSAWLRYGVEGPAG